MRTILLVVVATAAFVSGACAEDGTLALPATKDARITFYPTEADFNGGRSPRLRTSNIKLNAGEAILMDFDRTAITAFLEKQKDRQVLAKLVLVSRGLRHGSTAKVEVASLDTASDWIEGEQAQAAAAKGEPTFKAAQHETKAWTTSEGKDVPNLRDLFYDAATDTIKTLLNGPAVTVKTGDSEKPIEVELEGKFLEHLAKEPACRGLIVFNRDRSMLADFYSREHDTNGPKLVLVARDAKQDEAKK